MLGRVSQLHMAEKKPKQVPDAGDVSLRHVVVFRVMRAWMDDLGFQGYCLLDMHNGG